LAQAPEHDSTAAAPTLTAGKNDRHTYERKPIRTIASKASPVKKKRKKKKERKKEKEF
jgi:hypothetical protein